MLTVSEKIFFLILAGLCGYLAGVRFYQVFRAISRGKPEDRFDHLALRLLKGLWLAVSQQTVFKKRPFISLLHALVLYGFVFYLAVNLVDLLEGFVGGLEARGDRWNYFNLVADVLTTGILVGIAGLMIRRYGVKSKDFSWNQKTPLHEKVRQGIPRDSAIVGGFIFFHVGSRLLSKASQIALSDPDPFQPVASFIALGVERFDYNTVQLFEHMFWWFALGSILLFLPYFARSKHIHLLLAPLNLAFKKEKPGTLMPLNFSKEENFGVAKLEDFSWPRLLDAYSCIMCNRCQEVCPAYTTGKALSPAAILISERYELNQILPEFSAGKESPRSLMDFALSDEAVWACTTCNACVEVCPVGNEPMLHILDVRRERVMMQGEFPQAFNNAFKGMERNGNPWNLGQDKRTGWTEGLAFQAPTVEEKPDAEVLYWVGCAPSYDPRAQKIARSMAEILQASGIAWAILGKREKCTGDAARRAGNEYLFTQLAEENVATLNQIRPKTIVTTCPHCFHTLANEYQDFGGEYNVKHHTEYISELMESGKIRLAAASEDVTFHDPCYLGRHNQIYDKPREVIKGLGLKLIEPGRKREDSFCCGAGGAQFWKEEEPGNERVSANRYRELKGTGAGTIATGCPFCMQMMNVETAQEPEGQAPKVLDVAELVAARLQAAR